LVGLISSGFRPTFRCRTRTCRQNSSLPVRMDSILSCDYPFRVIGLFQCILTVCHSELPVFSGRRIRRFRLGCQRRGIASGKVGMEWAPALTFDVVIRQSGHERLRHTVFHRLALRAKRNSLCRWSAALATIPCLKSALYCLMAGIYPCWEARFSFVPGGRSIRGKRWNHTFCEE